MSAKLQHCNFSKFIDFLATLISCGLNIMHTELFSCLKPLKIDVYAMLPQRNLSTLVSTARRPETVTPTVHKNLAFKFTLYKYIYQKKLMKKLKYSAQKKCFPIFGKVEVPHSFLSPGFSFQLLVLFIISLLA